MLTETGPSNQLKYKLLLVLLMCIWGSAFPVIKFLQEPSFTDTPYTPMQMVLFRFIPLPFFCLFHYFIAGRLNEIWRIIKIEHWRFLVVSQLGVIVYHLPLALGINYISSGVASLIMALNPIFTFFLALYLGIEKRSNAKLTGVMISLIGVMVILNARIEFNSWGSLIMGCTIVMITPLSFAFYIVGCKGFFRKYDSLSVTYGVLIFGSLPLLLLLRPDDLLLIQTSSVKSLFGIIHLGIICTLLGYGMWNYCMNYLSPTTGAIFNNLIPIVSSIIGVACFRESINGLQIAGMAITIAGIVFVNK